ncbi:copper chaperone PCu(A)C [Streptomyces sp. I05A-00742]|uniref:copper chaperone PCu(A)C n=1 Tax=Streptomyces sp. I05A-00742 TaxID=2732853 RepID=UPI0014881AA5|nr:copper chaperone PCu(A)C [Streptomyces sp. I05A-00742]
MTNPVAQAAKAALVPFAACVVTLGGLGAWTASGAAGRPADVTAEDARVLVPFGADDTAAFVRLRNRGDVDDELLSVTAPSARGAMLARTVVKDGAGNMEMIRSVPVPARDVLAMSPHGTDIMITSPPRLKVGDRLPLTLRFRESGTVRVEAEVVRAGSGAVPRR